jgi:cytoskeletal protein RodZ
MKNLGEILLLQRKKMHQTPDSIYKNLKIHPKYIKALEENNYSIFDSSLHASGFLKIYAGALGLNVEEILALWRREFGYAFKEDFPVKKQKFSESIKTRFVVTPKGVLVAVITVLLISFFGYLYYAYKNYQGPPSLEITSPEDNVIVTQSLVDVTGKTDIDATLLINGEVLLLKPDGHFATSVNLREGVNTLSITSINRLEKKTEKVLTVIYRPERVLESTGSARGIQNP